MNNTDYTNVKNNKKIPELLIVLICSAILIYLSLFSIFPLISLPGIILFAAFSCLYSVILSCGKKASVLLVPLISLVLVSFAAATQGFDFNTLVKYANLIFALLAAIILFVCENKKSSKSVAFAAVTTVLSMYMCTFLVMLIYSIYEKCDINTISGAIEDAAKIVGDTYRDALTVLIAELPEGSVDTSLIRDITQSIRLSFKMSIPSAVVIFGMAVSALCVVLYKPLVSITGNKEKCLDGRIWTFALTRTSAVFFELIFTAYVLVTLFGSNFTMLSTLINLVSVLMVPFAYIGIRFVYNFFKAKTGKKLTGAVIIIAAFLILSVISGTSAFFMLASLIGASSTINKGRFKSNKE